MSRALALAGVTLGLLSASLAQSEPPARLQLGQRVKVEGKEFQGNLLIADEVEVIDTQDDEFEIEGLVRKYNQKTNRFYLGNVPILIYERTEFENAKRQPSDQSKFGKRMRVKVKAKRWEEGWVKARSIRIYGASSDEDIEIEGSIDAINSSGSLLSLSNFRIQLSRRTEYKNLPQSLLESYQETVGGLRRDDDEQHPEPLSFYGFNVGGRVSSGYRLEKNFDLDEGEPDDDQWLAPELRMEVSRQVGEHSEFYARFDARGSSYFGDNPELGGRTQTRFREGFFYWGNVLHKSLGLQVGRQRFRDRREFLFDERLDAVRLHFTHKRLKLEAAAAKPLYGKRRSTDDQLYLIGQSQYRLRGKRFLSGYVMKRNDTTPRDDDPLWYGLSSRGRINSRVDYWTELARMSGRRQQMKLSGFAVDAGFSFRLPVLPFRPTLSMGYAYGSGDKNFEDGVDGNFRQTGLQDNSSRFNGLKRYRYYGLLLEPELRNIKITTIDYGIRPGYGYSLNFVYHTYRQVLASKKVGDLELGVDPRGRDPRLGKEFDVVLAIRKIRNTDLTLAVGLFTPGPAFVGAPAAAFVFRPAITFYY